MPDSSTGVRPTLEAVAVRAGVSRATVSRVVNGSAGVRPAVADRVRQAVEELGYVPNHAARTLVTRRNGAVAVIIAEPEFRIFSDPFFEQQLRGISRELSGHDSQLVLLWVEGPGDYERIARYLGGGHVDGALAFSVHNEDGLPSVIRGTQVHTVFGGRPGWPSTEEGEQPVTYVDSDNRGGAREAVRHLLSLGRERIAHLAGPPDQTSALDRWAGYRDVLLDTDPVLLAEGDFTEEGGARAMARLLHRCPDVDAVFAANDLMALGALRALHEHGRRVPDDVALVGFDDMLPVAAKADPPLTTIRQDVEGMGRVMVRLLMHVLNQDGSDARTEPGARTPGSVIMPTELVRRSSA